MKNARNELEMIALLDEEAEIAAERYRAFMDRVGYAEQQLDIPLVQGGRKTDVGDLMDQAETLRMRATKALVAYYAHLSRCRYVMDRIDDTKLRRLLEGVYVDHMEHEDIKHRFHFSDSQVYRMKQLAMDEFQRILDKLPRDPESWE